MAVKGTQGAVIGARAGALSVLIADDQPEVRSAVRLVLEHEAPVGQIDEAASLLAMIRQIEQSCPDVLFLDWELPGLDQAHIGTALQHMCPHMSVIALTCCSESMEHALHAGIQAFVGKVEPPDTLLRTLRELAGRHSRGA